MASTRHGSADAVSGQPWSTRPRRVGSDYPGPAADLLAAIISGDEVEIERVTRQLVNLTMFGRYWASRRGILIEHEAHLWEIQPVAQWGDAIEAERRPGAAWAGEWSTVCRVR